MEIIIQILINSIVSGLILSLVAIGFTYIFKVTKVFHLAHGGVYVSGAFIYCSILTITNNWFLSIILSVAVVVTLISLIEKTVYLPLNKRQSNQSISLIASMGLYVIIVNVLAMIYGNENKTINNSILGSYAFDSLIFTKIQILQGIVGIVTIVISIIYLKLSKSDLTLKSVSDNETISKVFGINTEKERLKVFIFGSILVCIAAVLKTMEIGIDPQAGMSITLTAAVVAILVSRLNIFFIVIFSITLTLLQNSVEWFLNAQWKEGITFLVLLLVILLRTEGIISYNLRKDRA
jgi:branched-chain amino acid transport system permease protein